MRASFRPDERRPRENTLKEPKEKEKNVQDTKGLMILGKRKKQLYNQLVTYSRRGEKEGGKELKSCRHDQQGT